MAFNPPANQNTLIKIHPSYRNSMEVSFKASPFYGIGVGGGCGLGQAGRKILVSRPQCHRTRKSPGFIGSRDRVWVSKEMQQSLINCQVLISCVLSPLEIFEWQKCYSTLREETLWLYQPSRPSFSISWPHPAILEHPDHNGLVTWQLANRTI